MDKDEGRGVAKATTAARPSIILKIRTHSVDAGSGKRKEKGDRKFVAANPSPRSALPPPNPATLSMPAASSTPSALASPSTEAKAADPTRAAETEGAAAAAAAAAASEMKASDASTLAPTPPAASAPVAATPASTPAPAPAQDPAPTSTYPPTKTTLSSDAEPDATSAPTSAPAAEAAPPIPPIPPAAAATPTPQLQPSENNAAINSTAAAATTDDPLRPPVPQKEEDATLSAPPVAPPVSTAVGSVEATPMKTDEDEKQETAEAPKSANSAATAQPKLPTTTTTHEPAALSAVAAAAAPAAPPPPLPAAAAAATDAATATDASGGGDKKKASPKKQAEADAVAATFSTPETKVAQGPASSTSTQADAPSAPSAKRAAESQPEKGKSKPNPPKRHAPAPAPVPPIGRVRPARAARAATQQRQAQILAQQQKEKEDEELARKKRRDAKKAHDLMVQKQRQAAAAEKAKKRKLALDVKMIAQAAATQALLDAKTQASALKAENRAKKRRLMLEAEGGPILAAGIPANAFTTGAKALQAQVNAEVSRVLGDFRILLERTVTMENEVYSTPQYGPQVVRASLVASVEKATAQMRTDLGLSALPPKLLGHHGDLGMKLTNYKGKPIDLHAACSSGNIGRVTASLMHKEVNNKLAAEINALNNQGQTPMFLAARAGHRDVVAKLLRHKGDPNIRSRPHLYTPLHLAAKANSVPLLKMLLENGADSSIKSHGGKTSFDFPITLSAWTVLENTEALSQEALAAADAIASESKHGYGAAAANVVAKTEEATPAKTGCPSVATAAAAAAEAAKGPGAQPRRPDSLDDAASDPDAVRSIAAAARKALKFNLKTQFYLGHATNDLLNLGGSSSEGDQTTVWGKHTGLFRYTCADQDVTLLVANDVKRLVKNHPDYSKNKKLHKALVKMHGFAVNTGTLSGIHAHCRNLLERIQSL